MTGQLAPLAGQTPGRVSGQVWSSSKKGRLVVKFKTPPSVSASLRVTGKTKTVLTKPAAGRNRQVVLPPGRYKLAADPATLNGRRYEPRLTTTQVEIVKGKTTKVTLRMKKVRLATELGVSNLTSTTAALVWKAPKGAKVKLRRTPGDNPAKKPAAGTGVKLTRKALKARKVTDISLAAGGRYTYTFFSRTTSGRWTATPGLTINTPDASSPAAYVIKPGAIVVEPGDPDKVTVSGDGTVVLDPANNRPDPALGAAVILPISDQLPAGLVGKITTINPNGTLILGEGDIPSAFDYLDLNYDLDQLPAQRITAENLTSQAGGLASGSSARGVPKFGCEFSSGVDADIIDLALSYNADGYARHHIDYSPIHLPSGISFDIAHTSTLTGKLTVTTSASCGISIGAEVGFMAGPIPYLLKADIYGNVSAKASQTNTVNVTAGGWAKGKLAGGKITIIGDKIDKTSSTLTTEGEIAFEIGADITFGPGIATTGGFAGAVAGLNANLSIYKLSLKTISPGCKEINQTTGITMGVKASIWLGPLAASTYANIINQHFNHAGYPKSTTGCTTTPTSSPTSTPTSLPTPGTWTNVSAGSIHACGVRKDGSAWCWGYNYDGQLGDGTVVSSQYPVRVGTSNDWASVTVAMHYSCGVRTDGSAWCWGSNEQGQLGNGTTLSSSTPSQVGTGSDWAALSTGGAQACGLQTDGSAWCWGARYLGDGSTTSSTVPVRIGTNDDWTSVTSGGGQSCGVRTDGSAWCWGGNLEDPTNPGSTIPVRIGTNNDWSTLSTGRHHSCGVRTDGSAWCWGYNPAGELGDGTTTKSTVPVRVGTTSDWAQVWAGGYYDGLLSSFGHSCGVRTDGSVWCWGGNDYGQLGNGTTERSAVPVQVGVENDWLSVSTGGHTCGLRTGGSAWCWGRNWDGELGDGNSPTASSVPVRVVE